MNKTIKSLYYLNLDNKNCVAHIVKDMAVWIDYITKTMEMTDGYADYRTISKYLAKHIKDKK
ncbi:MAG: hypothetical protein WC523_00120 [Patescibacteria group bacterium]